MGMLINAIEKKNGKWEKIFKKNIWGDEVGIYRCSCCKKSTFGNTGITYKFNYCPNCGAEMDGEKCTNIILI